MTASIVQNNSTTLNAGQSTISTTLSGTTTGNSIVVIIYCGQNSGGPASTVSDGINGTYTNIDFTGGSGNTVQTAIFPHGAGGNITITAPGTYNYVGMIALEVTGVTSSPLDGHIINSQSSPGVGSNVLTIGPPSPNNTSNPAFVIAFSACEGGTVVCPTVGTGYTSYNTFFDFGGGAANAIVETKNITSSSTAATFSIPSDGTETYIQSIVILDAIVTGPPSTNTFTGFWDYTRVPIGWFDVDATGKLGVFSGDLSTVASGSIASNVSGASTVAVAIIGAGAIADVIAANVLSIVNTAIVGSGALIDQIISPTANINGNVTGKGALAGTISTIDNVTAAAQATGALADSISTTSIVTATATLIVSISANAVIGAIILANGLLVDQINGSANVQVTAQLSSFINSVATVQSTLQLLSQINSVANVAPTLIASGVIIDQINGTGTIGGNATGIGNIIGNVSSTASVQDTLLANGILATQAVGSGNVQSTLQLLAQISGTTTILPSILANGSINDQINGGCNISSNLSSISLDTTSVSGSSIIVGSIQAIGTILTNIVPTTNVSSVLIANGTIADQIVSSSSITSTLQLLANISATSNIVTAISGKGIIVDSIVGSTNIVSTLSLFGKINGSATLTGSMANCVGVISDQINTTTNIVALMAGSFGQLSSVCNSSSLVAATCSLNATIIDMTSIVTGALSNCIGNISTTINGVSATLFVSGLSLIVNAEAIISSSMVAIGNISTAISGSCSLSIMIGPTVQISATCNVSANLIGMGIMSETIGAVASIQSTISLVSEIIAIASVSSHINGTISAVISCNGSATCSASLRATGALSNQVIDIPTLVNSSVANSSGKLISTLNGSANISGSPSSFGEIASVVNDTCAVLATLSLLAVIEGSSSIHSTLSLIDNANTNVSGYTTSTFMSSAIGNIACIISANTTIEATLQLVASHHPFSYVVATASLFITINGTSFIQATLGASNQLDGQSRGSSTLSSTIEGIGELDNSYDNLYPMITGELSAQGHVSTLPRFIPLIMVLSSKLVNATISASGAVAAITNGTSADNASISGLVSLSVEYISSSTKIGSLLTGDGLIDIGMLGSSNITSNIMGTATSPTNLVGNSYIKSLIINYLADKRIYNPSYAKRGHSPTVAVPIIPQTIKVTPPLTPIPIIHTIPTSLSITKSGSPPLTASHTAILIVKNGSSI